MLDADGIEDRRETFFSKASETRRVRDVEVRAPSWLVIFEREVLGSTNVALRKACSHRRDGRLGDELRDRRPAWPSQRRRRRERNAL